MRGKAFIVYKDANEETRAKASSYNFLFLGSRINVNYAKTKFDIIVKLKGQQIINKIIKNIIKQEHIFQEKGKQ